MNQPAATDPARRQPRAAWPAFVAILLVAVAMASFNLFYQHSQHGRPTEFWGPRAGTHIMRARRVVVVRLMPEGDTGAGESIDRDRRLAAATSHDITGVPGLIHVRKSLLIEASYAWDEAADSCVPLYEYALRFEDGDESVTMLFSLDCPRIALAEDPRELSIRPLGAALTQFFAEQFPPPQ